MSNLQVKKGDKVQVIAGKDKGKKGKVLRSFPSNDRVLVEGANMIKKHARATGRTRQAGIIEREAPIHVSKVMLLCDKCSRPTRIGRRFLEDGKKVRYCKSCGEVID